MSSVFSNFHTLIGHGIEDVEKWAPSAGADATKVVTAINTEAASPEIKARLEAFLTAGAALVANTGMAVSEKGLNPMQDIAVFKSLEDFVKSFTVFHTLVQDGLNVMEGKKATSTVAPVVIPTPEQETGEVIEPISVEPVTTPVVVAKPAPIELSAMTPGPPIFVPKGFGVTATVNTTPTPEPEPQSTEITDPNDIATDIMNSAKETN